MKRIFFDWNIDHILGGLITQAYCALLIFYMGGSLKIALVSGALSAIHWYHGRENAQYEYMLEKTQGYNPHPQDFKGVVEYLKALNPFVWPQKWDLFAPTIAVSAVVILGIMRG